MTATEVLRRLLDERGVKWRERVWGGKHSVTTFWHARGVRWHYRENRFGELLLHADGLTPEQAIAATLGATDARPTQSESSGTCHNIYEKGHFKCSECGHYTQTRMAYRDGAPADPRFCPWCGRKVVEPTTNDVDVEVAQ